MQGAPKRQVNAEEMLAELKRALESSTPALNAPPPPASAAPRPGASGRENWPPPIDRQSARVPQTKAVSAIAQPARPRKSKRPISRRWKLTAAGLALAGAAAVLAGLVLMNQIPNPLTREFSAAATEGPVSSQNDRTLKPSGDSRPVMEDRGQAAPLQTGALETPPGAEHSSGKQRPGSSRRQSGHRRAAPAGPGGDASADAQDRAGRGADRDSAVHARFDDAAASGSGANDGGPDGRLARNRAGRGADRDSAVHARFDDPAASAQAPTTAAPPAASQATGPDGAPIATAPSTPASTDSPPLPAERPKPNATSTASVSNESDEPPAPKLEAKKKPRAETSLRKPRRSAKASAKSLPQADGQATEPAAPKDAERSPEPAQAAGNPAALAPVAAPSVQQRLASGVTHAFGYLAHLPGALIPHLGGPSPGAHQE